MIKPHCSVWASRWVDHISVVNTTTTVEGTHCGIMDNIYCDQVL
jgi:hypothetical protein